MVLCGYGTKDRNRAALRKLIELPIHGRIKFNIEKSHLIQGFYFHKVNSLLYTALGYEYYSPLYTVLVQDGTEVRQLCIQPPMDTVLRTERDAEYSSTVLRRCSTVLYSIYVRVLSIDFIYFNNVISKASSSIPISNLWLYGDLSSMVRYQVKISCAKPEMRDSVIVK